MSIPKRFVHSPTLVLNAEVEWIYLLGTFRGKHQPNKMAMRLVLCRVTAVQAIVGPARNTLLLIVLQITPPSIDDFLGVALSPANVDKAHVLLRIGPGDRA